MDAKTFIENVRAAQEKRPKIQAPAFDERDLLTSAAFGESAREIFERNFKSNDGIVFDDAQKLAGFLKEKGFKRGIADAKLDDILGLDSLFEISRSFDREGNPDSYDFGISKASMAIAETGAIVLKDSDTDDRMASIAPWAHIAVFNESQIVPTLAEALSQTADCPYAIYVGGPSKTTDVEGILVEGVHGPGIQIAFIAK